MFLTTLFASHEKYNTLRKYLQNFDFCCFLGIAVCINQEQKRNVHVCTVRAHEYFLQLIFDLQLQSSCMKSNLIDIILNIKYFNQNANDFSCAVFLIFSMSDDPTWFDSFNWSNDSFSSQSRSMYGTFDACSAYRNEI